MLWRQTSEFHSRDPVLTRRIILAGVPLNAVANLAFLALFLVPMLRGRAVHSA